MLYAKLKVFRLLESNSNCKIESVKVSSETYLPFFSRFSPHHFRSTWPIILFTTDIRFYAATRDVAKFERLKGMLENPSTVQLPGSRESRFGQYNLSSPNSSPASSPRAPGNHYGNGLNMGGINGFRSGLRKLSLTLVILQAGLTSTIQTSISNTLLSTQSKNSLETQNLVKVSAFPISVCIKAVR